MAFTYQTGGIGDIRARFVSHTNEFQVDKTENNTKIFGYADNVKTTSSIPYRRGTAKILIDGLQVLKGFAFLRESSSTFRISVFEQTIDFFSLIKDIPLTDLDFGDSPVTWDAAYIDSVRAASSGIVSAVIQYGNIDSLLATPEIGDFHLPSVYYKTVFDAIFENAGFTKSGNVLTDNKYTQLILPYQAIEWPGSSFTMDQLMPDLTQDQFIRHFSMGFGAMFRESDGDIQIRQFEELINDRLNAVNWTDKRATNLPDRIVYGFSNYAQRNIFNYANDLLSGSIDIDNENLEPETTIYQSEFNATTNNDFDLGNGSYLLRGDVIPIWDTPSIGTGGTTVITDFPPTQAFDNDPEPTLALVRSKYTPEPAILFDGNSRTNYLVGYFNNTDGGLPENQTTLAWDQTSSLSPFAGIGLLNLYYPSLQDRISRAKTIERYYYLTLLDIAQLDLFRLVYDDGAYYFINRIVNFVPGKVTKVELFKV